MSARRSAAAGDAPDRPGAARWVPDEADLEELRAAVHSCRGCELWAPATQPVFSEGERTAAMVLVGEQPGDVEDQRGEPFVGPAGRVLDDALAAAGIEHGEVYLTNAVKHFRFAERGKRRLHKKPGVAHIRACAPWLVAELAVVRPRVVVCLGATAGRAVLGREAKVTAERGRVLRAGEGGPAVPDDARVLVTTHPSALLRLRGKGGWDEAFEALVADLRHAAAVARGRRDPGGRSGATGR